LTRALFPAALLVLLVVPAGAHAYELGGRAWPDGDIRYHVVDSELKKPESAKVFVRLGQENCGGAARVGYPGRRGVSPIEIDTGCGIGIATLTAVHEFGHILGLGHETDTCARMNPSFGRGGTPDQCKRRSLDHWLAHPVTKDDVRGARELY
jgi:hypothetical protein